MLLHSVFPNQILTQSESGIATISVSSSIEELEGGFGRDNKQLFFLWLLTDDCERLTLEASDSGFFVAI